MQEYYGTMPWLAVPPDRRDVLGALPSKFGIMGIPTLIVFDENGEQLTTAGVAAVQGDPKGDRFPWKGHAQSWATMMGPLLQVALIGFMIYLAIKHFMQR